MKWRVLVGEDGCPHLRDFKRALSDGSRPGLDGFQKANRFLRQQKSTSVVHCLDCPAHTWLHVCLHCVYIGCFQDHQHVREHQRRTGHHLSLETVHYQVHCGKCDDFIYDSDLQRVAHQELCAALDRALPRDATRAPFKPWEPHSAQEHEALLRVEKWIDTSTACGVGLRGLHNLGNTCFTNCIIQSLAHNPLLRNYFLTGLHQRELSHKHCPEALPGPLPEGERVRAQLGADSELEWGSIVKMREGGLYDVRLDSTGDVLAFASTSIRCCDHRTDAERGECLACVTGAVFNELYSGVTKCFAPFRLLYAVWQHSKHLAGYAQQDAHEFFIALLDGLHQHCETPSIRAGSKDCCNCIIHRVFTGGMQSDLTCTKCGCVSTTIDPFWDISVDIRPAGDGGPLSPPVVPAPLHSAAPAHAPAPPVVPGVEPATPKAGSDREAASVRLTDCLRRFTRAERLGANERISCKTCNDRVQSTKRLSVCRLPLVISIQLKRFEHVGDTVRKIDSHVTFPEVLNMGPYLSHPRPADDRDDTYAYTLFAVVNHKGTLQNGHYTCFVRLAQEGAGWFLCDDEKISAACLSQVLDSQGYMLFYVKSRLEYQK